MFRFVVLFSYIIPLRYVCFVLFPIHPVPVNVATVTVHLAKYIVICLCFSIVLELLSCAFNSVQMHLASFVVRQYVPHNSICFFFC